MLTPGGIVFLLVILAIAVYVLTSREQDGLDRDLIQAAGGDKRLAQRLLDRAKLKYPGKSDSWYVEKVIYDLGRDRGVVKNRSSRPRFSLGRNARDVRNNIFLFGAVLWAVNLLSDTINRLFH